MEKSHAILLVIGFVGGLLTAAFFFMDRPTPVPTAAPAPTPSLTCRIADARAPERPVYTLEVGSTRPGEQQRLALTCSPSP